MREVFPGTLEPGGHHEGVSGLPGEGAWTAFMHDGREALPGFLEPLPGTNLDDEQEALIGRAIPAAMAAMAGQQVAVAGGDEGIRARPAEPLS